MTEKKNANDNDTRAGQEDAFLARQFEEKRSHLRAVAYRMLGSLSEADDAVQESWLHVSRADHGAVENMGGWLTTIVARICLDMLRSRQSRREEALGAHLPEPVAPPASGGDPEQEVLLADSVGVALLVVLETLAPIERLAFVLHDLFGMAFEQIAPIVGRTPAAARQLASRARRRVQGQETAADVDLTAQRHVVDAYLAAARAGDFDALIAVLHPDVVLRGDDGAAGTTREVRGAANVAAQSLTHRARFARPALVDGAVGIIVAPRGRLLLAIKHSIEAGKIVAIDVITDPSRLRQLNLAVLDGADRTSGSGAAD